MAAINATRGTQPVLCAEFTWNYNDTMVNTSGASDGFSTVASHVFDVIALPYGAVVVGGDVTTETAAQGSTAYNVTVGDATSANRYLGTTDKTTAARTALVPTGFVSTGEAVRLTVAPTVAPASAGKFTLRVQYIIRNRLTEVAVV